MTPRTWLLTTLTLIAGFAAGCRKGGKPGGEPSGEGDAPAATAGPGSYARSGPLGLAVESCRLGKVRMRDMMNRQGESKDDVFVVRTRVKLFDTGVTVKQPAIQPDGSLMPRGLKLTDSGGREFKPVVGFGLDAIAGRRMKDAVLTAAAPETTDVLTFESTAGAAGDLTLDIPTNYTERQPDGAFKWPERPGRFRVRIPHGMWAGPGAEPPAVTAGPGNGVRLGPVEMTVEAVRFGKTKMTGVGVNRGQTESQTDLLSVTTRFRVVDPKAVVRKGPFIADGIVVGIGSSPGLSLTDAAGTRYDPVRAFGLDRMVGRQAGEVKLSAGNPEVRDLLTFDGRAGAAGELTLTVYPSWKERGPNGQWAETAAEGEFRFRIPRSMWAK